MAAAACISLVISCWLLACTAHACEWPDFFLIPPPDTGDDNFALGEAETSWETLGRVRQNATSYVNGRKTSHTWVKPIGRNSLKVTDVKHETDVPEKDANVTILTCVKHYGNNKFLVKVNRWFSSQFSRANMAPSYQCIQLVQRSPFVVQWRRGEIRRSPLVLRCPDGFAELSPWPLVYYPVRRLDDVMKAQRYAKLHEQYQPCPRLGGFHMDVFDKAGNPVESGCNNNFPSPRLELECYHGDGMRILQNHEGCSAYSNQEDGAKLNCLGSWQDGDHTFSVLVPNDAASVNTFHCLRINHRKPTSERAILFLDTVCQPGDISKSAAFYYQLKLRRKASPGLCHDFSDQCFPNKCDTMSYSCAQTCKTCPFSSFHFTLKNFDKSIRGRWILPLSNNTQKTLYIVEKEILAFDVGYFTSYNLFEKDSQCIHRPSGWDPKTFEYVLAGPGEAPGCVPRVSQLRARRVSHSVLLLQMPAPAPLRENSDFVTPSHWCRNNYRDAQTFKPLFRPYSPYVGNQRDSSDNINGYLTLIAKYNQIAAPACIDLSKTPDLREAMDTNLLLQFKDTEGKQVACYGKGHFDRNLWKLRYMCPDGVSVEKNFTCLGEYAVSADHHAIVVKTSSLDTENEPLSFKEVYYCLLIPFWIAKDKPLLLNNAYECDPAFVRFANLKLREPVATLKIIDEIPTFPTVSELPKEGTSTESLHSSTNEVTAETQRQDFDFSIDTMNGTSYKLGQLISTDSVTAAYTTGEALKTTQGPATDSSDEDSTGSVILLPHEFIRTVSPGDEVQAITAIDAKVVTFSGKDLDEPTRANTPGFIQEETLAESRESKDFYAQGTVDTLTDGSVDSAAQGITDITRDKSHDKETTLLDAFIDEHTITESLTSRLYKALVEVQLLSTGAPSDPKYDKKDAEPEYTTQSDMVTTKIQEPTVSAHQPTTPDGFVDPKLQVGTTTPKQSLPDDTESDDYTEETLFREDGHVTTAFAQTEQHDLEMDEFVTKHDIPDEQTDRISDTKTVSLESPYDEVTQPQQYDVYTDPEINQLSTKHDMPGEEIEQVRGIYTVSLESSDEGLDSIPSTRSPDDMSVDTETREPIVFIDYIDEENTEMPIASVDITDDEISKALERGGTKKLDETKEEKIPSHHKTSQIPRIPEPVAKVDVHSTPSRSNRHTFQWSLIILSLVVFITVAPL